MGNHSQEDCEKDLKMALKCLESGDYDLMSWDKREHENKSGVIEGKIELNYMRMKELTK